MNPQILFQTALKRKRTIVPKIINGRAAHWQSLQTTEKDEEAALLHKHLVPEDLFKSLGKGLTEHLQSGNPLVYNRKITIQNPTQLDETI